MKSFPGQVFLGRGAEVPETASSYLFFERLPGSLFDGVFFVNQERKITYWNHGAEAITGYLSEEVVGKGCGDNLLMHTDDRGTQLCLYGCPLSHAMHANEREVVEVYLRHKRGHRVPVSVRVAPVVNDVGETVREEADGA